MNPVENQVPNNLDLGRKAFNEENFEGAFVYYSKVIEEDPNNKVAFSNRSACSASQKNYDQALADALKCIDLDPNWYKGYSRRGLAEYYLEMYDEAEKSYRKSLSLHHTDSSMESLQLVLSSKESSVLGKRQNSANEDEPDLNLVKKVKTEVSIKRLLEFFVEFQKSQEESDTTIKSLEESPTELVETELFQNMTVTLKSKMDLFKAANQEVLNEIKVTSYEGFIFAVTQLLMSSVEKLEIRYREVKNNTRYAETATLNCKFACIIRFMSFFCGTPFKLFQKIKDYYNSGDHRLYTMFTHYIIYMVSISSEERSSGFYRFLLDMRETVNNPDFDKERLKINLSKELIEKIYKFCCSEVCKPFFDELLEHCRTIPKPTETYLKYQTWEDFSEKVLKPLIYEQLQDKIIVVPNDFHDGPQGETTYNLNIILSNEVKKQTNAVKRDAILLIITVHQICQLSRILLVDNGIYYRTDTPEKFSLSEVASKRENMIDPNEIGFYLEEKCIFFDYLLYLKLFEIPIMEALFILEESNWKEGKFKKFLEDIKEKKGINPHRKQKGAVTHNRHLTYQAMKKLNFIGSGCSFL